MDTPALSTRVREAHQGNDPHAFAPAVAIGIGREGLTPSIGSHRTGSREKYKGIWVGQHLGSRRESNLTRSTSQCIAR